MTGRIWVAGSVGLILLGVAEFVLPHYVSRFVVRLGADLGLTARLAPPVRATIPETAVETNEFAFEMIGLAALTVQAQAAGVFGVPGQSDFWMAEQGAVVLGPYDVSGLLEAQGYANATEYLGGIKQLITINDSTFALGGFSQGDCYFGALIDLERMAVVEQFPCLPDNAESLDFKGIGGGYAVMGDALFMALGTASDAVPSSKNDLAQDAGSPYGKILRYDIVADAGGVALQNRRIFTSGHRNPQGMVVLGNHLLAVEHGPKGGDEINVIVEGANYGWPLYSAGSGYDDADFPSFAAAGTGFTNPVYSFVPSIGISDISACPREMAEKKGGTADCVIVSALRAQSIFIVMADFAADKVHSIEQVPLGARIREVFVADDVMYLVPDAASIMRVKVTAF